MGYYASSSSPQEISIHVPREGDDSWRTSPGHSPTTFQSTSPVRGTTLKIYDTPKELTISIHVPREGDDYFFLRGPLRVKNFNPRPP